MLLIFRRLTLPIKIRLRHSKYKDIHSFTPRAFITSGSKGLALTLTQTQRTAKQRRAGLGSGGPTTAPSVRHTCQLLRIIHGAVQHRGQSNKFCRGTGAGLVQERLLEFYFEGWVGEAAGRTFQAEGSVFNSWSCWRAVRCAGLVGGEGEGQRGRGCVCVMAGDEVSCDWIAKAFD